VAIDASDPVVKIRREMEQEFGNRPHAPHDSQRILVRARD
jgi:hypothetical protein